MSANKALIEAHYAASEAGDLVGMLAPLADDISWTEAAGFPYAGTYVGPDAVAAGVFGRIQADFSPFVVAIDAVYDSGVDQAGVGTLFGVGSYSGTYSATGRSFEARVVHVWRVRDGRAIAFEQIVDSAQVRAALP